MWGIALIRLSEGWSRHFFPFLLRDTHSDTQTSNRDRFWWARPQPVYHGISLPVRFGSGWSHQGKQELVNSLSGANSPSIGFEQGCTWGDLPVIRTGVWGKMIITCWSKVKRWKKNWVLDDIPARDHSHDCPRAVWASDLLHPEGHFELGPLLFATESILPGYRSSFSKIMKKHWPKDRL